MSCVTAQTAVDVDALVKTASFSSLSSNLILLTSLTLLTSLPDSRRLISAMQAVLPSINLGLCSFSSLAWPISLMLVTVSGGMVTGMVTGGSSVLTEDRDILLPLPRIWPSISTTITTLKNVLTRCPVLDFESYGFIP
jgi:hypothetical protein